MQFESLEELQAFFADDEFATKCLGAEIESWDRETGEAVVSMTVDDRHHNAQGFVMGGVFFTLADFALAVASNVGQEPTASVVSNIEYLRRAKGDRLWAKAYPTKLGRTLAFFTVDVFDGEDRHIARIDSTCMRTSH